MKKENIKQNINKTEKALLDRCITAAHPEMVRNSNDDEPCDDSRS